MKTAQSFRDYPFFYRLVAHIRAAELCRPGKEETLLEEKAKGSQEELAKEWTRATFIVETETLETLKDYAYTERLTMKEVVQMALDQFIDGIDTDSLLQRK